MVDNRGTKAIVGYMVKYMGVALGTVGCEAKQVKLRLEAPECARVKMRR